MQSILYAEIYLICLVVIGILILWMQRTGSGSSSEKWLSRLLLVFALNYLSNLLFTVFNGIIDTDIRIFLSYAFKSMYHATLIIGVILWCIYAEIESRRVTLNNAVRYHYFYIPMIPALLLVIANLFTGHLFRIDDDGRYVRGIIFQFEMAYLIIISSVISVRILQKLRNEQDPSRRRHLMITAAFPLCLLAAWVLTIFGESVPVICVATAVELLSIFMGATISQISLDKLTQVNNRQNLMNFLNYKCHNYSDELYLMMIDLDFFKTINDRFGHLEGDNALIQFSSAIKKACAPYSPRPYIARYGGDEFIVVLEGDLSTVEKMCADIRREVSLKSDSLPYDLTTSIGYARLEKGQSDPKILLEKADAELYKVKNKR